MLIVIYYIVVACILRYRCMHVFPQLNACDIFASHPLHTCTGVCICSIINQNSDTLKAPLLTAKKYWQYNGQRNETLMEHKMPK